MTTIRDVARLAGVSPTTVSHVLSNRRPVAEETRLRVLEAIEKTEYVPNVIAQGLVSQRTNVIGVCFPLPELTETNPSLITLLMSGSSRLREFGYQLLFITTPHEDEKGFRQIINSGMLDGVVLLEVLLEDPRVEFLKQHGKVPFILIGRCRDNEGINFVDIDSAQGVYDATIHLIEMGHERIVFVGGYPDGFSHSAFAQDGYKQALKDRGLPFDPLLIRQTPQREESAIAMLDDLLDSGVDFTSIICLSEFVCLTLLKELRKRDVKIPEEVSLISFGNSASCSMAVPALTAISLHFKRMTQSAIDIMINRLSTGPAEPTQILLSPAINVRASTGPVSTKPRLTGSG